MTCLKLCNETRNLLAMTVAQMRDHNFRDPQNVSVTDYYNATKWYYPKKSDISLRDQII